MPEPWDADALEFYRRLSGHTPAFSALFSALPARPACNWRPAIAGGKTFGPNKTLLSSSSLVTGLFQLLASAFSFVVVALA